MSPKELQRGWKATKFKRRQQKHGNLGCLDTNFCIFLDKKKKARSSMINSREWSCFLAEQERMGCSICPQPSAMPCPAFPLLFIYFFFNPPSWINVVGLVLTRHRSDSALAKWHAACGTWAQEADCFLLWRKNSQGRTRGGGWGAERLCANHRLPILLSSPRLLLLQGSGRREGTRLVPR